MTSEVHRGRLAKLFGVLRFAVLAAALIPASLAAHAQAFTLPPPEKMPTFLGIDLPLRPGERLLPLGNSGCSMVVFAPRPEHYEAYRNLWGNWEWSGACRFGLIHGNGKLSLPNSGASGQDTSAIYGTRYVSALYRNANGSSISVYSGEAFSDLSFKLINLSGSSGSGVFDRLDSFGKTSGNKFAIGLSAFDTAANARNVWVQSEDVSFVCENDNQDIYKPFAKEVKKVCARNPAGQFVVYRREGTAVFSYANPFVWLKACPLKKETGEADCPALMRDAIGKHYGEIEAALDGSPEVRPGTNHLIQEILNRYAPLEAALEARLKDKVAAGGAQ